MTFFFKKIYSISHKYFSCHRQLIGKCITNLWWIIYHPRTDGQTDRVASPNPSCALVQTVVRPFGEPFDDESLIMKERSKTRILKDEGSLPGSDKTVKGGCQPYSIMRISSK